MEMFHWAKFFDILHSTYDIFIKVFDKCSSTFMSYMYYKSEINVARSSTDNSTSILIINFIPRVVSIS